MPKPGGNQCGQDGHQHLLEPQPLSAWAYGICILPVQLSDKPLQGSQDASNQQFGFLVGAICFEIVPYCVAQASLSLSSAGKLICHHA